MATPTALRELHSRFQVEFPRPERFSSERLCCRSARIALAQASVRLLRPSLERIRREDLERLLDRCHGQELPFPEIAPFLPRILECVLEGPFSESGLIVVLELLRQGRTELERRRPDGTPLWHLVRTAVDEVFRAKTAVFRVDKAGAKGRGWCVTGASIRDVLLDGFFAELDPVELQRFFQAWWEDPLPARKLHFLDAYACVLEGMRSDLLYSEALAPFAGRLLDSAAALLLAFRKFPRSVLRRRLAALGRGAPQIYGWSRWVGGRLGL